MQNFHIVYSIAYSTYAKIPYPLIHRLTRRLFSKNHPVHKSFVPPSKSTMLSVLSNRAVKKTKFFHWFLVNYPNICKY